MATDGNNEQQPLLDIDRWLRAPEDHPGSHAPRRHPRGHGCVTYTTEEPVDARLVAQRRRGIESGHYAGHEWVALTSSAH